MLLVKLWPEIGGKCEFFYIYYWPEYIENSYIAYMQILPCVVFLCFVSFHMFSVECWASTARKICEFFCEFSHVFS